MVSVPPPSSSCRATFVGDGLKRYDWEVIGDARIEGTGNSVLIVFNGMQEAPSEATSVEAKVTCIATYTDSLGLDKTIRSNQISVQWNVPKVGLDIEGEVEVLRNSSQVYHAKVTPEGETSGEYTWRWTENGLEHVVSGENYTIDFSQTTVAQIILNCEVNIGGMHKSADPITISILDQNYLIKVVRKDYSGTFDTKKREVIHDGPDITDDSLVFVHFNVDDDDGNGERNNHKKCGWDFLQSKYKNNKEDDDLCEIKIQVVQADGMENVPNKKIVITVPSFLKLWKTKNKGDSNILIGDSNPKEWSINAQGNNSEVLNTTLYVEGVDFDKKGIMIINVGDVTRKLEYATCSVGGKDDQPSATERKAYRCFENLIDCEWCVLRGYKKKYPSDYYNCIAFSVDPYMDVFKNLDFINGNFVRQSFMCLGEKYAGAFWIVKTNSVYTGEKGSKIHDRFWVNLGGVLTPNEMYLWIILVKNILRANNTNIFMNYRLVNQKYMVSIRGSNSSFKECLPNFINIVNDKKRVNIKYVLAMHDYNSDANNNLFEDDKDTIAFFENDLWKENNNDDNYIECPLSNMNSKIIYYKKFHAARKASLLNSEENKTPTNIPDTWRIFASKCGAMGVILHLDKQIEGDAYGKIYKEFK